MSGMSGTSSRQWQEQLGGRRPGKDTKTQFDMLGRGFLGQLADPPDTAISVPLQQATSLYQGGFPAMQSAMGLGGGMADRLGGGTGGIEGQPQPGQLLPASMQAPRGGPGASAKPSQWGTQSREQLGLPDRSSYFPLTPNVDEILAMGQPPVRSNDRMTNKLTKREDRLERKIARREDKGKNTAKQERKLAAVSAKKDVRAGQLDSSQYNRRGDY